MQSVNLSDSMLSIEVIMHHTSYGSSLVTVVGVAHCSFHSHRPIRKVYTLYDRGMVVLCIKGNILINVTLGESK